MKRSSWLLAALLTVNVAAHDDGARTVAQLRTRDAHALLWLPDGRLLLGHHDGVNVSTDRGATWKAALAKPNFDAMTLQRAGGTVVLAGHLVYAVSTDARRWTNKTPRGVRGFDFHAYAVDPKNTRRHFAWEASSGLYGSVDGGVTFKSLRPSGLPSDVIALAVDARGALYAASAAQGVKRAPRGSVRFQSVQTPEARPYTLTVAADGAVWIGGTSGVWRVAQGRWARINDEAAIAVAVNPKKPGEAVWIDLTGAVRRNTK